MASKMAMGVGATLTRTFDAVKESTTVDLAPDSDYNTVLPAGSIDRDYRANEERHRVFQCSQLISILRAHTSLLVCTRPGDNSTKILQSRMCDVSLRDG